MRISNNILKREVNPNHFLVKYKAYCFDAVIMDSYKDKDWLELEIITTTGRQYYISREDFFDKAYISYEFKKKQYILRVKDMQIRSKSNSKSIIVPKEVHSIIKQKAKEEEVTISELMSKLFKAS